MLQVLEWLDSHGSIFLNKNTAIGKSFQKAKALQKNFEHFEMVAQVFVQFFERNLSRFFVSRYYCKHISMKQKKIFVYCIKVHNFLLAEICISFLTCWTKQYCAFNF